MHAEYTSFSVEVAARSRFQYLPSIPLQQKPPTRPVAIADMANMFGVTHRTLHFYEEKKLLHADRIGAMRVYGPHQVRIMALINLCRETGMAIAQIQDLFGELDSIKSQEQADAILRDALAARKRELVSGESLIRRQMQQVNELLNHGAPADDESNDNARPPFLNEFEFECLGLMSEGYTPIRIGNATGRSVDDILVIEAAIIRKFGSTNRFQAVAKAVLLGVIGN
ncbi:MerR family transcriptional regulator [Rhizobium sp.]